jgi:predicted nucleic acid-binding protein
MGIKYPPSAEQFVDSILQDFQPTISAITEIELLCWKTASENDLVVLRDFIEDCVVFELDKDIKLKTVEIRKNYKLKLPDAIIAATAVIQKCHLAYPKYF